MPTLHPLKISSIERITPDAVRLQFAVPKPLKETFRFTPGQYLTLESNIEGDLVRRSYSICSGPGEALSVGIKRLEGGKFSTFAHRFLSIGDSVSVMPPAGRFVMKEAPQDLKHVALAAGSGITPILSIVGHILEHRPHDQVWLVYGNRNLASAMFLEAIHQLKDRFMSKLSLIHILSREDRDSPLFHGRIDSEKTALLLDKGLVPTDADAYYLCGPGEMIESTESTLTRLGVSEDTIRKERFSAASNRTSPTPSTSPREDLLHVQVQLDGVSREFFMDPADSVIEAAEGAGIEVPWSCAGGMCSTCRCKLIKGSARMDTNFSLEPWELEKGYVLACQLRPSTDLHLDFDDQ